MRTPIRNAFSAAVVAVLCVSLRAADAVAAAPVPVVPPAPDLVATTVRLIGALALIAALVFGGAWFLRNGQRVVFRRGKPTRLRLVEARSLGQRQALYLVACDDQEMLLAATATSISLLATIPSRSSGGDATTGVAADAGFSAALRQAEAEGKDRDADSSRKGGLS